MFPSLFLIKCFWLTRLWFANTAGATSRLQFLDREFFQSTSGWRRCNNHLNGQTCFTAYSGRYLIIFQHPPLNIRSLDW